LARANPGDGHTRRRPNGLWEVALFVGYKPDGKKDVRSFYGKTRAEALKKRDAFKADATERGFVPPPDKATATVAEFFDYWLGLIKPAEPKGDSTYAGYEGSVRLHVLPNLGALRVRALTADHLNALYDKLADRPRAALYVHQTLSKALETARARGYCAKNVARDAERPKWTRGEVCPPNVDELGILLEHPTAMPPFLRRFVVAMAGTGARPNELTGLERRYYDRRGGAITVVKTRGGKAPAVVRETKTPKSRRRITLPAAGGVVEVFDALLAEPGSPDDPLFRTESGRPYRVDTLSAAFNKALKAVGLVDAENKALFTLYDLRHFHATQLLAAGVPLHEVSWRLGHSSVAITADVYGHWVPGRDQAAADAIGRVLGAARVPTPVLAPTN
jgi:integrase